MVHQIYDLPCVVMFWILMLTLLYKTKTYLNKEKLYADLKKSIKQSIKYFITLCRHFETVFLFYFVCLFFPVGYYKTGRSAIE